MAVSGRNGIEAGSLYWGGMASRGIIPRDSARIFSGAASIARTRRLLRSCVESGLF